MASEDAHLLVGAKDRKAESRFSDSAGTSCARGSSAAHGLRMVWGFGPGLRQEPPGTTESANSGGQEKQGEKEGKGLWVPFPTIKKTDCLSSSPLPPRPQVADEPFFLLPFPLGQVQGFPLLASLRGHRRRIFLSRVQQFSRSLAHL